MVQTGLPTDGSLKQMQRDRNSSWTLRPQSQIYWARSKILLVPYLAIWRTTEKACTDTSPDHLFMLADFAAQGLYQPGAMSLHSIALEELFCHILLLQKRQFSIFSNFYGRCSPPVWRNTSFHLFWTHCLLIFFEMPFSFYNEYESQLFTFPYNSLFYKSFT